MQAMTLFALYKSGFFASALQQTGPWQETVKDIARFLRPEQQELLGLWSEAFFASKIEKMFRK